MSSYFITGVARGLGFEFVRQLSTNPANTIIGLVRDKTATEKKVSEELSGRKNVHLIQGDMVDYASLKKAVDEIATITGGKLDYVIANAAFLSVWAAFEPFSLLAKEPEKLEKELVDMFTVNVVGNIHLFNLITPLVLKGNGKKIIAISSGLGDQEMAINYELFQNAPYSISKTALDMAVAKFHAEYRKDDVLFMCISPGMVDTGYIDPETALLNDMIGKFMKYAPDFNGPTPIDVAIQRILSVMDKSSVEAGDGGKSLSQFGNKQWL
ncbi:NAD(P)-binding protein [Mollisia scopiformis]|uniref:NAD(P)-binding protein n=1 Tax=Mollisia scopiformis TaxID=149040 RepID=A0A194XT30_MOLSC|nr:NAD(P)-binding protein [Mollisia scopiformis]KUJ23301.1 NAD(P)-binding protein [Mollisia scopiformis]